MFLKGLAGGLEPRGVVVLGSFELEGGPTCIPCSHFVLTLLSLCLASYFVFVDDMAELLLGESKLEQYLKEHPLRQGASPRGPKPQLTEVRKHLTAALDRGNLKVPGPLG